MTNYDQNFLRQERERTSWGLKMAKKVRMKKNECREAEINQDEKKRLLADFFIDVTHSINDI